MEGLVIAARWEMMLLLVGLMLVVVYKILTGGIEVSGLLTVKGGRDDGSFSPARVQMLMATVLTAMYYLLRVLDRQSAASLPDLPAPLVAILGGSHAVYLGGKARSFLFGKTPPNGSK